MHSCVIGALAPQKMNRNALNISIIKIGSPTIFFRSGPFSHAKGHLIVASLWSLILSKKNLEQVLEPLSL